MALAVLSIDLEARLAKFEQSMSRANGMLATLGRNASTSGQRVAEIFTGMFSADVALRVVQGLATAFPALVNSLDDLNDAADATGSSVENLSALEDIARRNGATLDLATSAVVKLNQVLKEGDADSGPVRALKAIGLEIKELQQLDPSEALKRVADALSNYSDDGNKARLTQVLLGKSARELAPFLKDLADAGKLNATVTTQQAAQAERFNKMLAELKTNASNAGRAVAGDLLPALNSNLLILAELAKGPGLGAAYKEMLGELFTGDVRRVYEAQASLEKYNAKIAEVDRQLAALRSDKRPLIQAGAASEIQDLETARAKLVKFADAYRNALNAGGAGGGRGSVNPPSAADKRRAPDVTDDRPLKLAASSFTDFQARIGESVGRLIDDGAAAKLAEVNAQLAKLNELEMAGLDSAFLSDARAKLYTLLPAQVESAAEAFRRLEAASADATNKTFSEDLLKRMDEARTQISDLTQGNQALVEEIELLYGGDAARRAVEQSRIGNAIAIKEEALALREKGTASEAEIEALRREIELLRERKALLGKRVEADETVRKIGELRTTVQQGLQGTFSSVLGGDFQSVGEMWKRLLTQMASQALAAQLTKALFGDAGGGGGAGGGGSIWTWLAKLVFSAKGNAFDQAGVIPFANGGVVNQPTLFGFGGGKLGMMAEAGSEAVMPLRRGRDGRLGVSASGMGGGGASIVQHITVQAGASRNEVMVAMETARRAAVGDILEMQRRGRMA